MKNEKSSLLTEFILNIVAEQNAFIMEEMSNLKFGVSESLLLLGDGIQDNFEILTRKIKEQYIPTNQQSSTPTQSSKPTQSPSSTGSPAMSSPPTATQPPPRPRNPVTKTSRKTHYTAKPRVLYVGDSIAQNVWKRHIEDKTKTRITTKKAYSSVHDKRAKWPQNNMKDVTEKALEEVNDDDQYQYVVLSAPTVDISNIDTSKVKPSDSIEGFKLEVE